MEVYINWSKWCRFPDPRQRELLCAPLGCGVYELRNLNSGELILFGKSKNVASRMTSLLPTPYGTGTRRNSDKRNYVWESISCIEYRTVATETEDDAVVIENKLKNENSYIFRK